MMKNKKLQFSTVLLLFTITYCFAGPPEPPPPYGFGPEPAPIDNYLLFLALAAILLGFYYLTKNKSKINNN
ncbi:hypothetical protein [Flavobacterium sp. SM2513]|uniref:hypothetical protein n=1 Tax=Flavobacterium sp. SM2513 TaxID=3424766 RepID=UPI003D7F9C35